MENSRFEECMNRIRNGDREALKEIYESYHEYIYHLLLSITGNHADAEDLSVDFFLKLWNSGDRYAPGNGHKRWITVIARNLALDFLRRKNREIPYESEQLAQEADRKTWNDPGYDEALGDLSVKQAMEVLTPSEKEIVHMKIAGDFTFRDIADILKIPMGTVTWRYRQAIGKLRRCGYEAL